MPLVFDEAGNLVEGANVTVRALGPGGGIAGGFAPGALEGTVGGGVEAGLTGAEAGAEGLAGGAGGLFTGGFGLAGGLGQLLGNLFNPATQWNPATLQALSQYKALGGQGVPTVGGIPTRSGGALDVNAMMDFIKATGAAINPISTAAAGELPAVTLPEGTFRTPGGILGTAKNPNALIMDTTPPGPFNTDATTAAPTRGDPFGDRFGGDLTGGAVTRGDPTTLLPSRSGAMQQVLQTRGLPGTGGVTPGLSAASSIGAANPNAAAGAIADATSANFKPDDFEQIKNAVLGGGSQNAITMAPGTQAPVNIASIAPASAAAPPSGGAMSDFWKEYGPWLGLAAGAGGLLYGLNKQNSAQEAQQQQAGLLNRVAGNVQSSVIDPTSTALAVNELIAKSGAASNQDISLANPLLDVLNSGKLPPAIQTMYDLALEDANAASKSRFANMGIGNSTELDKLMNANRLRNVAQQGAGMQDLYNLGLKTQQQGLNITNEMVRNILGGSQAQTQALTGAGGIYNQIAKDQIAADKELTDAIAKFATQLGRAAAT